MAYIANRVKNNLCIFFVWVILIAILTTGCAKNGSQNLDAPIPQDSNEDDTTRPAYNLGTCKSLEGNPYVLLLFLDDDESHWDSTLIDNFWNNQIDQGLGFIEENATTRGVELNFNSAHYATNASPNLTVKYNGIIESDILNKNATTDIMEQASRSVGYSSKYDMQRSLQELSGEEQIVYLILLNKAGVSYAIKDTLDDANDSLEYCVIFTHYLNDEYETGASTVAHELLHLFGAEDYYDPYSKYPNRAALAEEIYPNDIMLRVYEDVNFNELGDFTAYTIGWKDELPEECYTTGWWY